jgi:phospholipid/cholesterol/gamma-HCH transport system substrate-binding protein
MEAKREQAFVGLFVLIAAALLIFTVFGITGAFQGPAKTYHAKFSNAAGLEPGASVHYAGGQKIGRVEKMQLDPANPSLIDMTFSVKSDLPVKTNATVAILSYSPLGDNHLEILPAPANAPPAPLAPSGALLASKPYLGFNDLAEQVNNLTPQAQELLANLNERVKQLNVTIVRVNDLLNDQNRQNISGSLADLHGMLNEDRPVVRSALKNVNAASEKITPLLDQLHETINQANEALKHADGMIGENREEVRASVAKLHESLNNLSDLSRRLDQMLDVNSQNIDEILENLHHITENMREFTDIIKTQPSSLIHSGSPRQHVPGGRP